MTRVGWGELSFKADHIHFPPAACHRETMVICMLPPDRSGSLEPGQLRHCFMGLLTALLPVLGLPSYNGSDDEQEPVAASPIASTARDCLQAVCNLLGPHAYLGIAAQHFLNSPPAGTEAICLAEVMRTSKAAFNCL